jgi:hypothetical protein
MSKFFKTMAVAAVFALASVSAVYAGGAVEIPSIPVEAGVSITSATITGIWPKNVLPGTVVTVEGSGFGTRPAAIQVGNLQVNAVVGWEDEAVFFRVPDSGVQANSRVVIGNAASEDVLNPAPAGSITVRFQIDTTGVTAEGLRDSMRPLLQPDSMTFVPPMYVKGEWIKSQNGHGNREASWDGGSRYRMVQISETVWIAESVFTPDNLATFQFPNRPQMRPMKFAFEDGNFTRNVVEFESDWAAALKLGFASADYLTTLHSDPGLYLSTDVNENPWWNRQLGVILAQYPVPR